MSSTSRSRVSAASTSSSSECPATTPRPSLAKAHRAQRRPVTPDSMTDGQRPPAAPRAPGRTYRLSDEERRTLASVSRTLTYGEEDNGVRTPTRRSARAAAQHNRTPPKSMLPASELSRKDLLARKRLGSPIQLEGKVRVEQEDDDDASSSTASATPSPSRSFRTGAGKKTRKRGVGRTDENAAPAIAKDDTSPRRQQPKRTCTVGASSPAVSQAPNLLLQRSLSNAWPSRAFNAPMLRSTSDVPTSLSTRTRQRRASPALCSPALSAGRNLSSPSYFGVGQMDYFSSRSANGSYLTQAH